MRQGRVRLAVVAVQDSLPRLGQVGGGRCGDAVIRDAHPVAQRGELAGDRAGQGQRGGRGQRGGDVSWPVREKGTLVVRGGGWPRVGPGRGARQEDENPGDDAVQQDLARAGGDPGHGHPQRRALRIRPRVRRVQIDADGWLAGSRKQVQPADGVWRVRDQLEHGGPESPDEQELVAAALVVYRRERAGGQRPRRLR